MVILKYHMNKKEKKKKKGIEIKCIQFFAAFHLFHYFY